MRRQAIRLGRLQQSIALSLFGKTESVDYSIKQKMRQSNSGNATYRPSAPCQEVLEVGIKAIYRRYESKDVPRGYATGLGLFDSFAGGFQPGHFTLIASRPAMGRSADKRKNKRPL